MTHLSDHLRHFLNTAIPSKEAVSTSLRDVRRSGLIADVAREFYRRPVGLPLHWFNAVPNLGDILSPVITQFVSGFPVFRVSNRIGGKILSIGSVAQVARHGDAVWGAGAVSREGADLSGCHVLAVRGPLTRERSIGDIPAVFGDPAMLLPLFYEPRPTKSIEVGVIPHYVEKDKLTVDDPNVSVIDVTGLDWRRTVDQICACSVVYASSLHGLIVAEAYGVPAIWISASDDVIGGGFKFHDYYASTDREISGPQTITGPVSKLQTNPPTPPSVDIQPLLDAWPIEWTGSAARLDLA